MANKLIEELYLSKSSTETYQLCGLKFSRRYIERVEGKQKVADKQAAIFGTVIHNVLEDYFKSEKKLNLFDLFKEYFKNAKVESHELFLTGERLIKDYAANSDNGNKILGLELEFKLFLDNGVPIKGIIDRVDEVDETTLNIVDYKTGYSTPLTEKQLLNDLQLSMYNLAIRQLYPKYKRIISTLDYLHYGKVSVEIPFDQLDSTKNFLSVIYDRIKNSIETGEDLEPKLNSYCGWCDYKTSCKAFQETILEEEDNKLSTKYNSLIAPETGLVVDYEKIDLFLDSIVSKKKILDRLEKDVKEFIKKAIEENGGPERKIKIGNTYFSVNNKKYTEYNIETLYNICKEKGINFFKLVNPAKGEVDKVFKKDKEVMEQLKSTAKVNFSEGYIQ